MKTSISNYYSRKIIVLTARSLCFDIWGVMVKCAGIEELCETNRPRSVAC